MSTVTLERFVDTFLDILQRDDPITSGTPLSEIAEWDSMSIMAMMAYADKNHGKSLMMADFKAAETVADLYAMVCQG